MIPASAFFITYERSRGERPTVELWPLEAHVSDPPARQVVRWLY